MTARDFLRIRWLARKPIRFIPIQTFGFDAFEPLRQSPLPGRMLDPEAQPTAGEASASPHASPAFSNEAKP